MNDKRAKKTGEICFWIGLMIELLIVIVDKSAYINPLESQLFRLTFLLGYDFAVWCDSVRLLSG